MPVVLSTRPSLDVDVNIFHSLYPVGTARWHNVLLITDDPGPNPGQISIYGDATALAVDYPTASVTYKAGDQFFDQDNVNEIHVLPIGQQEDGSPPLATHWSTAFNTHVNLYGLTWYYTVITTGDETIVAEMEDAINNHELMFYSRNYAGDRATLVTGTGGTEVTWTARLEGTPGNNHTIEYEDPGAADQDLALTATANANGGYDIKVSLATDGSGDIETTPADIVAAVAADSLISFLVFCEGAGTSAVSEETKAAMTGGGANAGTLTTYASVVETANTNRMIPMAHKDPHLYFPDLVAVGVCSPMNPGSFTMKNRIPLGLPMPAYTSTEYNTMRAANINSFFTNPAGHDNITDFWTAAGLYGDIQMAIDVLSHWQRMELWDLLSQPPAGYHKVPYDNDGFMMIADRLWRTLNRGARPQWNFIVSRDGQPACAIHAPTFQQTELADRKNRIYRPWWEATFKGAVHEVVVNGYLTVEFIPPSEVRLGSGTEYSYA